MIINKGISEDYPYLCEFINDSDTGKYILYLCMGGSGFNIVELPPNMSWREGVGEEYICYTDTYEAAEKACTMYIGGKIEKIIDDDPILTNEDKNKCKQIIPEVINETSNSEKYAILFKKLLKGASKVTADAIKAILIDIVSEAVKRLLF